MLGSLRIASDAAMPWKIVIRMPTDLTVIKVGAKREKLVGQRSKLMRQLHHTIYRKFHTWIRGTLIMQNGFYTQKHVAKRRGNFKNELLRTD